MRLSLELSALAVWVRLRGGIIGHLKAAISDDSESLTLSLTRDVVRTQGQCQTTGPCLVSFAAIVARVDPEELKARVERIYKAT